MRVPTITKLPSGSYHARVQIDGRRVSVTAGSKKDVERQIYRLKLKNRVRGQITLSDGISDYIESRSNILSPSTIRGYRIVQRNRFQSVMNKQMCDIKNWQKVVNEESRLVSPKTLKNAWGLIRAVLVENDADPGVIRLPIAIPKERAFLEPAVIKQFLQVIEGHKYEIAYLACLHGLRASEMLALDKCDVDSEIRVYKAVVPGPDHKPVLKMMTKNETSTRRVPVFIPRLTELVSVAPAGRLVTAAPLTLNRQLRKLCRCNNIETITLHELRHSFVSLMYFLHISEAQAMQFGGYADIQTMRKIYTHLSHEETENAKAKLRAFVGN